MNIESVYYYTSVAKTFSELIPRYCLSYHVILDLVFASHMCYTYHKRSIGTFCRIPVNRGMLKYTLTHIDSLSWTHLFSLFDDIRMVSWWLPNPNFTNVMRRWFSISVPNSNANERFGHYLKRSMIFVS